VSGPTAVAFILLLLLPEPTSLSCYLSFSLSLTHSLTHSLTPFVHNTPEVRHRCPFRISIKCRKSRLVRDRRSSSFTSRRLNDVCIIIYTTQVRKPIYIYTRNIYLYPVLSYYIYGIPVVNVPRAVNIINAPESALCFIVL